MKIVFLDVDGVLNAGQRVKKGTWGFHLKDWVLPHPINHVNRICRETGAKIVVSSTWRVGKHLVQLQDMFRDVGVTGEVIGKTPQGPCSWHRDKGYQECSTGHRGAEIEEWIRCWNADVVDQPGREVEAFVILDDAADMGDVKHRLVQTSWCRGMLRRDCDKAIQMLGRLKCDGSASTK